MEAALHRFVRLLRLYGVRVSVSEVVDAMRAAATPGLLQDRESLRAALSVTLVKDRRDQPTFETVFDAFFFLLPVLSKEEEHSHAHDDLADEGDLQQFTLSQEPGDTPSQGHSHGEPDDIRDYFRPEDLVQQFNLHQEANKLDMSSSTDEVVLSKDKVDALVEAARVRLSVRRLHNPGLPGTIAKSPGVEVDADLSVAQEMALLGWLADSDLPDGDDNEENADLEAMRQKLAPLLDGLSESLRRHLQKMLDLQIDMEQREHEVAQAEQIDQWERFTMEQSLRRIVRGLHGAPRPRRQIASTGTVDGARTMRANMRYDAIPFRPVTVRKTPDRPRLVVLADVSLSVRSTAQFTLHLVQGLASLVSSVRSFVFVDEVAEVTDMFDQLRPQEALTRIMAGPVGGGPIDVDADTNCGGAFATFLDEYGSAVHSRTTLVVLSDGRGNGHDPGMRAFEELTRRARHTIWLTPEPRYSWGLGRCDVPLYAEHCDAVHVVRGLDSLESFSLELGQEVR